MFTSLYLSFSDAQGQITPESVVVSGRNLNSSKLSCMSSLPARMRMIESKMKELECSQDYSHYKSNRKAVNRNSRNQKANPALKTKAGNK